MRSASVCTTVTGSTGTNSSAQRRTSHRTTSVSCLHGGRRREGKSPRLWPASWTRPAPSRRRPVRSPARATASFSSTRRPARTATRALRRPLGRPLLSRSGSRSTTGGLASPGIAPSPAATIMFLARTAAKGYTTEGRCLRTTSSRASSAGRSKPALLREPVSVRILQPVRRRRRCGGPPPPVHRLRD